jgi:hypothetical protein
MANVTKRTPKLKRTGWTINARAKFIEVLRQTGNVTEAAASVGLGRSRAYQLRGTDEEFAKAWEEAEDVAVDRLEREAWRRGVEGVDKPVYHAGKVVGHVREYSDTVLVVLLKAHRPEKYRDNVHAVHTGEDGGPIQVDAELLLGKLERLGNLIAIEASDT